MKLLASFLVIFFSSAWAHSGSLRLHRVAPVAHEKGINMNKQKKQPCDNPAVPGHPESPCRCASPQDNCPEHESGVTHSADWGAEYHNPDTETKFKGKVGDTHYYSSSPVVSLSLMALAVAAALHC